MSIEPKVSIDENGDEFVQYCVEIDGQEKCFSTEEKAEEALEESKPKGPRFG